MLSLSLKRFVFVLCGCGWLCGCHFFGCVLGFHWLMVLVVFSANSNPSFVFLRRDRPIYCFLHRLDIRLQTWTVRCSIVVFVLVL